MDDVDGEEISETEIEEEFCPGKFERGLEAALEKDYDDFLWNHYNFDDDVPYQVQYRPLPFKSNAFRAPLLLGLRCHGSSCAVSV